VRPPHLLRVEEGPERFAALLAALAAAGLRAGWLELRPPEPAAASLETAAALGARRAVAAGGGRSLALKRLRGEPVLRDLLREHFPGCALVLVRGAAAPDAAAVATAAAVPLASMPALFPAGDGWRIALPGHAGHAGDIGHARHADDGAVQHHDTAGLLAALRRPRPWAEADAARAPRTP
jgi:hypothetical protein